MNLKKLYMETIKSKTGYLFTVEDAKEIEKIIDYYETKYNETVKKYNNCYCERTDCSGRIKKEFIKYLEDEINYIQSSIVNLPVISYERNYLANLGNDLLRVLQKYKEIIGETNDTK